MATFKRSARLAIGALLEKRRYCAPSGGVVDAMLHTADLPPGSVYKIIDRYVDDSGTVYTLILANGRDTTKHHIGAECLPAFNLTKPYTNVPRYGIAWHTIRYHQTQARDLYRMNGIYLGRGTLESRGAKLDAMPSMMIGHAAIALAAVASTEHVIAVLTGTRGRRWQL